MLGFQFAKPMLTPVSSAATQMKFESVVPFMTVSIQYCRRTQTHPHHILVCCHRKKCPCPHRPQDSPSCCRCCCCRYCYFSFHQHCLPSALVHYYSHQPLVSILPPNKCKPQDGPDQDAFWNLYRRAQVHDISKLIQ
jgi:hypothetical protein